MVPEMSLSMELELTFRAVLSAVLGGLIGWERQFRNKIDSEIRTFAAVALGACTFALVSAYSPFTGVEPSRVAANVVTGIGFLGAAVILKDSGRIKGLATAASLWATASVGIALGYGMYMIGTLIALVIFLVRHIPDWRRIDSTYQNHDAPDNSPSPPR